MVTDIEKTRTCRDQQ